MRDWKVEVHMLNKKDLRNNATLFRDVAQLLTMWADDLDAKSGRKGRAADAAAPVPDENAEPTAETAASEAEEKAEEVLESVAVPVPAEEPEPLTYVKVRGILAGKSASGFKDQVSALIRSYGAVKLSDVDPKHYPELVTAVERLDGDNHA